MDGRPGSAAWASAGTIGVAFAAMLWWTWGTWPDIVVDFGRELYVPWRLSQGDVLYRDIAWLHGPLSPYLNAFWFRLFGVGLRSLVIGNLGFLLALVWLIFRVTSRLSDRLAATAACVTFLAIFGFSVGNYNYLSPYSHELTHGALLSFAAIACFSTFLRTGSLSSIVGAGLASGLVFLTKAEVFLALAAAISVGMTAAIWTDAIPAGRRLRAMRWLLAATVAPIAVTLILFLRVMSPGDAWVATAGAWHYVLDRGLRSMTFYKRLAGIEDPVAGVGLMLLSASVFMAACGGAILVTVLASRRRSDPAIRLAVSFAAGFCALGVATQWFPWPAATRPFPLLLFGLGLRVAWGIRRRMPGLVDRVTGVVQLTFVTFALCLMARILLNATFYQYGFVLAMPATMVLVAALLHWIPARLRALGWDGGLFRAISLGALVSLIVAHLGGMASLLSEKRFEIGAGPDRFLADDRATVVSAALREIGSRLNADQTLLVLPEGIMLNYLSRRVNPTPYVNFMPVELEAFGEAHMLTAFNERPPDFVAFVHKDTSEYGAHYFGRDYGLALSEWVKARYRTVQTWGGAPLQDDRFGISLLERAGPR